MLLLFFLVNNLQVFLEIQNGTATVSGTAFAVWDLLGHTLHCVATRKHQTWKKPVGQEKSPKAGANVFLLAKMS